MLWGNEDFIGPSSNRGKSKFTVSKMTSFCICMFREPLLQTCNTCLNKVSQLNVHKATGDGKANKSCKTFTRINQNGRKKHSLALICVSCLCLACFQCQLDASL